MNDQIEIRTLSDIAALDSEQFARMIPDLINWHRVGRAALEAGALDVSMIWVDDGKQELLAPVIEVVNVAAHGE